MTGTLRVLCRPAVCDGFTLAGVRVISATDAVEAAALLPRLCDDPKLGVIFVEEILYRNLPESLQRSLEHRAIPVVVPFPGPRTGAELSSEAELVEMLRRVIGYRVNLQ
jgi:vacuolar-type H+-ATPase subunit F/Vma7